MRSFLRLLRTPRVGLTAFLVAVLGMMVSTVVAGAPRAEVWERWTVHDASSTARVDHTLWDTFVRAHVRRSADGIARVNYGSVTKADRSKLHDYVSQLSGTAVSAFNRTEQKAFWINLYNALTVQVVLDHYPVESIREISISPGFFTPEGNGTKALPR